jgi:hypothetical protein
VLTQRGVEAASSTSISYAEQLHDVLILQAYTLKPDGRRIDVSADQYRVQAIASQPGADQICSSQKSTTVLFPEVSAGDLVVFSYRRVHRTALFPGQFSLALPFSNDEEYRDVRITLTAPDSMHLQVFARGVEGGEAGRSGDRRQWSWSFRNDQRREPGEGVASWATNGSVILVSTFHDYQALGMAYELRARPKAFVTERVRALASELTKDVHTERAQVEVFYNWVSKNIRFAPSCAGSLVPNDVDYILTTRVGDCKDHAALMQALMDAQHIPNASALVRIGSSSVLPEIAVAAAFNHVMNYVPSLGLFTDTTAPNIPFGTLPRSESDKPVVLTAAPYGTLRTPLIDGQNNWAQTKTKPEINAVISPPIDPRLEPGG